MNATMIVPETNSNMVDYVHALDKQQSSWQKPESDGGPAKVCAVNPDHGRLQSSAIGQLYCGACSIIGSRR